MKIFGLEIFGKKEPVVDSQVQNYDLQSRNYSAYNITPLWFDGEKTPHELGSPKEYRLDYYALRARSWQAFIDSDVIQNIVKKYCLWIVGPGLKLQAQPNEYILNKKNISLGNFTDDVENQFRLHAKNNFSSFSGMENLHSLAAEGLKNAILSGDALIVERFDGKIPTTELIDGAHIQDPLEQSEFNAIKKRGNSIIDGVEIDNKKQHVAFYVRQKDLTFKRIAARSSQGKIKAWLFYGMKHKIDDVRGMSLLTAVLETAAKMDRYKDATLGTAEENSKIPYMIEHNQFSTGEDPMINQMVQAMGKNAPVAPETKSYEDCEVKATKIAQTTSKQVYNMPVGSTVKRNDWNADLNFGEFFGVNIDIVCATIGIPAEIAMDKFSGSYSSSRAALKSWEYKMLTDREVQLRNKFYQPIYVYWLDLNVLMGNVEAPGYLEALNEKDLLVLSAYRDSRFIGATVPHIDPVKEVMAERKKLGSSYDNIPLTTGEQASENLNTGDFDQNIKKAENEKKDSSFFDPVADGNNGQGTGKVS